MYLQDIDQLVLVVLQQKRQNDKHDKEESYMVTRTFTVQSELVKGLSDIRSTGNVVNTRS